MSTSNTSFLSISLEEGDEQCLLCDISLSRGKSKDIQTLTVAGWPNLKEKAKLWSKINIPPTDKYYGFRKCLCKGFKHGQSIRSMSQ